MAELAGVHPAIEVLTQMVGTWTGRGRGEYPTIDPFDYVEDVTFAHVGKPFLFYTQRTRSADGVPLHAETGYLRVPAAGRIELVLAHPTGITEIDEGTVAADGAVLVIEVHSTTIGLSGSAKDVFAMSRSLRIDGDELTYTVSMAAVGQPLQHHLSATLHRVP